MPSLDEYYKSFSSAPAKNRRSLHKQELYNLYKVPKKDKGLEQAHFHVNEPNAIYQADLLYLPDDKGYKYALVVADACTGITDAVPLKERSAESVLVGFKDIFSRKILPLPTDEIQCDSGSEFKGAVKKYFNDKNIGVRYAKTARSRQTPYAEARNKVIGKAVHQRQTAEQLLTNEVSVDWVEDLPIFIEYMNKHYTKIWNKKKREIEKQKDVPKDPIFTKNTVILPIGTKVRVALDKPIESTGHKLSGHFRASDIRFDPDVEKIENVIISPDEPVLYKVSGKGNLGVGYTYNQLQVVPAGEKEPPASVIRGVPKQYTIKEIIGKKKEKNKIFYKIRWRGYGAEDDTWEPKSHLLKGNKRIKTIIDQYKENLLN